MREWQRITRGAVNCNSPLSCLFLELLSKGPKFIPLTSFALPCYPPPRALTSSVGYNTPLASHQQIRDRMPPTPPLAKLQGMAQPFVRGLLGPKPSSLPLFGMMRRPPCLLHRRRFDVAGGVVIVQNAVRLVQKGGREGCACHGDGTGVWAAWGLLPQPHWSWAGKFRRGGGYACAFWVDAPR